MKLFQTRTEMMRALVPVGGACAEIGVFEGAFSKQIVESVHPSVLYMIDLFTGHCMSGNEDGNNVVHRNMDDVYHTLVAYTQDKPTLRLLKGTSVDMLSAFPDASIDMVYIDGDHSYSGVKADLNASLSKVRPGGWIMGHDYEMNMMKARTRYDFGVKQAVDEFCAQTGLTIHAKALDGCVSFALQIPK
jgi:hypothetical protein